MSSSSSFDAPQDAPAPAPAAPSSSSPAARPVLVVGISGSLREGSYTHAATQLALEGARAAGARTELLCLRELRLPFRDSGGGAVPDDAREAVGRLRETVRAADGVILGSPEYHGSLSGALKNALDLLSFEELEGKMAGVCAVAGGAGLGSTLVHLRTILRAVHAWVVPSEVMVAFAGDAFEPTGRATDAEVARRLQELGAEVATFARLHRDGGTTAKLTS